MRPGLTCEAPPAGLLERKRPPSSEEGEPDVSAQHGAGEFDLERAVLCGRCEAPVARDADRVSLFGAHVHDRVNPAGYAYRIGCFARADGAMPVGPPSSEFPWFPRHVWRCAVCARCFAQLGWHFAGAASFFGLILDALREPPS
jgi:hypothetical protein